MAAREHMGEAVEDERRMSRGIVVFLAVLVAQLILLGVLASLVVTGILPIDAEMIFRAWANMLPRPFVYL